MPFLNSFCTWFSIRMGSIIVAYISLVKDVIFLILFLVTIPLQERISLQLRHVTDEYDFLSAKFLVVSYRENLTLVAVFGIVFYVIHICCALSLIHASYRLMTSLIWPFIIIDFIKLLVLSTFFVAAIIVLKKNVLDFNVIIVCLIIGGFYLIFQYYLWLCPVSLLQCLNKVESERRRKGSKIDINTLLFQNYSSNNSFKPIKPSYHYYQYKIGDLPKLYF